MAELFIEAFVTVLFEKLASGDLIRLARSAGIYSELNKWKNTLSQVRAVLVDAGQKQIRDESVQLWLNELQHLAYEIDDVFDDLVTEFMRRQLNQESYASASTSTSKVLNIIPTKFHALKYGRKMSSKLDKITTKLRDLVEKKNLLGLNDNVQRSNRANKRTEETSLVDVSKIVGRQGDKEALLGMLLSNESSSQNVSVVSIFGLGGIGKTTLAQVLYNDKKVKDHFELMSWVCVSDEFDVFNISKAIFQAVGGGNQDFANLNLLQVALTEKLSKKRFLLVLDDVWNENYNEWELLQRPFAVGNHGSKILMTTRNIMVASLMDSVQAYPLELLSNEEALSLFAQHALGEQHFDSHPTLKLQGEGIVEKCKGLPLALITLGRVLRTKKSDEEWEEVLNSEIWNLETEGKILPALRLSYYDLPPHLKQMFAYCCLIPKDYHFKKDELVLVWMAEGLLYKSNVSKTMESFGQECFEELESRSFFQESQLFKSRHTMHDLINDLATSVGGEFFLMLGDKMDVYNRNEALQKFRHLSFVRERYVTFKKFKALERARGLRTFLPMPVSRLDMSQRFFLPNEVLIELFSQLRFLRVLSLANYDMTEVPQSIAILKHLRYLNFSNTGITCLPKQVGDLYNLQSLLVSGCNRLSSLPNSLVKLKNLRHLDISDTPELNKIPLGIRGLTGLQTLSKVIIGGSDRSDELKISDLKGLVHLQGQLSIKGLHKVMNAIQAKEASLQQKKGLRDLEMEWSDVFDEFRNEMTEYEVLEGLRPFEKLTSLKILYYMGSKFPSWVGDASFVCLTQLTLRGCRSCTCLPTLGHLPSLQKLFVESMNGLKRVGLELFGPPNSCNGVAFPSLEVLEFRDMEDWEEWSTSGGDKAGSFPCLREIFIIDCPKLDVVGIELMPSLCVLHVEGCSMVVLRSMVGVSSSIVRLIIRDIKGLTQLHRELLEHLKAAELLCIFGCDELTYLCESEAEACEILVSLQKLVVKDCVNLVSLGEKKVNMVIRMESFREVVIERCPRLESYYCTNGIEKLGIYRCPSITSLTFPSVHDLPSTLKILSIEYCDNVEVSWLLNSFLSSLESISIRSIPNLRLFPEGCLVHLTKLTISGCDNIESIPGKGFGILPFLCLRSLEIDSCKNLKSFPHAEHLQSLTSLAELTITHCPSLDYFPTGLWPPNLSSLVIGGLKKPISEWGLQNFPTSLVDLVLHGENSGVVSFAKAEDMRNSNNTTTSFLLPSSVKFLFIGGFMELESVSKGLQHLTCLEHLYIFSCSKLRDLPETLLPSLLRLWVRNPSPELRKRCRSKTGMYWSMISQIPHLDIKY